MYNFPMVNIAVNSKINSNIIQFDKTTAEKYNINDGDEIIFCVGQTKEKFISEIRTKSQNNIYLSNYALKLFRIIPQKKYGIKFSNNEITIGPVVGVMADEFNEKGKPFGGQSFFIKQLITYANDIGIFCFAFSPYNIKWEKNLITGYTFKNKSWVKGIFPLPNVIYPRVRGQSPAKNQIRRKLEQAGCVFINPPLIGKWQTHQILSKNPELTDNIPDTKLIKDFTQVDQMIKKHKAVYIKPINGSQGKNIIKVVKKKNSSVYEYQYEINNKTFRGIASDITKLRQSLRSLMGKKTYIIQNQINLLRHQGNILDLRVLVQKDHTGNFSVTGKACRVGRPGSITSNISQGGSGGKVDNILMRYFPDRQVRERIMNEIDEVAIKSVKTIEEVAGLTGEMGVDIGVDTNGKVWFIEANIRPARQVFLLIGDTETRFKSVIKPLLYSRYLARF